MRTWGRAPALLLTALLAVAGTLPSGSARGAQLEALETGRDWRLAALEIKGNKAVLSEDIEKAMVTQRRPWYDFWRFWRPLPEFDPITFRSDLDRLRQLYRNHGYYEARIEHDIELPEEGNAVRAVVYIEEKAPVFVDAVSVTLEGVPLAPAEERLLLDHLPLERGEVFDQGVYERSLAYLRAYYREHGFARVEVTRRAEVDVRRGAATATFHVDSGPPSVFGEVHVSGPRAVDPAVVRREVAFEPGKPFKQSLVERTRTNLVALKLFSSVRLEEDESREPRVDIRIRVREGPSHEVRLGVGYDTEEQIRGLASWRDYNFLGGARQLGFTARASFIRRTIAADFLQPHFPGKRDRIRVILSEQQEEEDAYTNDRSRFSPRLEWGALPTLTPYVFYRIEYDSLSDVEPLLEAAHPGLAPSHGVVSGLGFGVDWNTTDDLIDPTRGWVTSASVEPVGGFLGGDFSFVRVILEGRRYQPLPEKLLGALRVRAGSAETFGDTSNIPLFERFYAGGVNSVRGYERRHLGPTTCDVLRGALCVLVDDEPVGGKTLLEASIELRRPITEKIGAAVFFDAGQVWRRSFTAHLDELRYGTGFGVRYKSPVGPLRLDLGFPLQTPPLGDARWQVYVSIGQTF